ncbi:uncharacterized protein LOC132696214 [Cylas formicarius]|uniref:uncharacterized protein LOC132696214 n=1 Tax=Cylas formicarius TaxID=197179 RepID=UPI00295865AF|nr:uncharacterized protein LOC132696214 [Cylas formicarius]
MKFVFSYKMDVSRDKHQQIRQWLGEIDVIKQENFKNIEVTILGTSEKGDGYVGDIIFTHVSAVKVDGQIKVYDFVLKTGKDNKEIRARLPVRKTFEREIYVYTTVIPAFQRFLHEKGLERLSCVAQCFGSKMLKDQEIIILQNLKKSGYALHDRHSPFNWNHLNLTLETYAKWHALSFAMRDQNPEIFVRLTEKMDCVWSAFHRTNESRSLMDSSKDRVASILKRHNESTLLSNYNKMMERGIKYVWSDLLNYNEQESVILHGDCWNSNLMFKYETEGNPSHVVMLDFQLSRPASPMFDLSYHLYMVCSADQLENLSKILLQYHGHLSKYIRQMGSDPDQLYPYSKLLEHWRTYSKVGLILGGFVLPLTLTEKKDVVSIENLTADTVTDAVDKIEPESREKLDRRLIAIVKNALEFKI